MNQLGRPTELSEELFAEIRKLVLVNKNMKETAEILEIPYNTMSKWSSDNFGSFADKWLSYEHERKLEKAEGKIESLVDSKDEKIALQASALIVETLGKNKGYSKRQEITGKNGKDLVVDPLTDDEKEKLLQLLTVNTM
jgi:hypothetical protein